MSLTKMKKAKLLALVMVFAMLFSCGIALGDNDGENGNGHSLGGVPASTIGDSGSIETPADNGAPADENGTPGLGNEPGNPGDLGEADGDGVNQVEDVSGEGEGQLDSNEGGADQSEGTPDNGDGNNPSGVELTKTEPQLLMAPMAVESEADDDGDYLDLTLTRIRPVGGAWQDITNGMSLIPGQEYEVEYKAANTYSDKFTYVKIVDITLQVDHNGSRIITKSIDPLDSRKNKTATRQGTYTFTAQEGQHTLGNFAEGHQELLFWKKHSAQVSFSYQAVNTPPECQKVYLKDAHKLADSLTGKFKDGKSISTGDNGGLTDYAVVWHFVLNQITKDLDEALTINVSFANAGEKSVAASKVNKQMQHFYVGTSSHDILQDAYICLPAGVTANENINLSHIWVDPEQGNKGSVRVIKTIGSTEGDPQEGITFTLTPDANTPRIAGLESEAGYTATTNENGIALFSGLKPGRYMLEEDVPEGFTTSLNDGNNIIEVAAGKTETVNVVNTPDTPLGSVKVIKTISTTNKPHAGVEFTLTRITEVPQARIAAWSQTVATGDDGIALFENLAPGSYNLAENVPTGYMTSLSRDDVVTVSEDEITVVYVENTPLGSVKVNKTISTGGPQKGVKFLLSKVMEEAKARIASLIEPVLTNDEGIALFENLEPGRYMLEEEVPEGYNTSLNNDNRFIEVTAGETTKVDVVNTPTGGGGNPGGGGETPGGGGGSSGGGSSGGGETSVTIPPEPTAVLPEKDLQVLPEPTAVEPEREMEVQPEATAAGPELPRTGGNALALILGSLVAGSGLFMMSRSRKEEK